MARFFEKIALNFFSERRSATDLPGRGGVVAAHAQVLSYFLRNYFLFWNFFLGIEKEMKIKLKFGLKRKSRLNLIRLSL